MEVLPELPVQLPPAHSDGCRGAIFHLHGLLRDLVNRSFDSQDRKIIRAATVLPLNATLLFIKEIFKCRQLQPYFMEHSCSFNDSLLSKVTQHKSCTVLLQINQHGGENLMHSQVCATGRELRVTVSGIGDLECYQFELYLVILVIHCSKMD